MWLPSSETCAEVRWASRNESEVVAVAELGLRFDLRKALG